MRSILYTHNNLAVRSHFETLGVKTTQREDGKVFPLSMSAKEVRSALLSSIKKAGFEIKTESAAVRILNVSSARLLDSFSKIQSKSITDHALSKNSGSEDTVYEILTESSATYHCRNLIIACGGCSYPQTGSDGSIFSVLKQLNLEITELSPALVPIHVQDYPYSTLSGISFQKAELRILSKYSPENWSIQNKKKVPEKRFYGPLLFTHNSLSGPLILDVSRYLHAGDRIALSYLPGVENAALSKELRRAAQGSTKNIETLLCDISKELGASFPKRFAELLTASFPKLSGRKASSLSGTALSMLAKRITDDEFCISSLSSYQTAMCTSGGVSLSEIDLKTMEAKKYPRLFIIGECLDVDGDTGGYNLQFAFSSAAAAVKTLIQKSFYCPVP